MDIRTYEPELLVAGDTWQWYRPQFKSFDVATYTLSYKFVGAVGNFEFSATADGGRYLVDVPAAMTGPYVAGEYKWQAYISNGSDRFTVATGYAEVEENLAASTVNESKLPIVKKQLD
ncbi:MAG: hypothetical protein AAGJ55_11765, partial [Cyanobacteria bacterium J06555_12]